MRVKFDENGYITEWAMCPANESGHVVLPDGVEVPDFIDQEDKEILNTFYDEYGSYHMVDGILTRDENKMTEIRRNRQVNGLRHRREKECFNVINRSSLWYGTLTDEQKSELQSWYQEWLDVTDTLVVPTKPEWLK